ncbi:hypothetical protein ACTORR_24540 [Pseudomonas sp. SAR267]|uniref:hypothetical protein n=1 Tax=Pseudomonas sp. SAR267 TaxID=3454502 RepID=UPI003F92FF9D
MKYALSGVTIEQSQNPTKVLVSFREPATGNDFKIWVTPNKPIMELTLSEILMQAIGSVPGKEDLQP